MPVFGDQMKNFTDHLRISIENRTDALDRSTKQPITCSLLPARSWETFPMSTM